MKAPTTILTALTLVGCAAQPVYVSTPQTASQTTTAAIAARCENINKAYSLMTDEIISNGRLCLESGRFTMSRDSCRSVLAAIHVTQNANLIHNAELCVRAGYIVGMDRSVDEIGDTAQEAASVIRRIKIAMRIR